MIEVFKTNVENRDHAKLIISLIINTYPQYAVNFDLEDCDKILRIDSGDAQVDEVFVHTLLACYGYSASILVESEWSFMQQLYDK